MNAIIETLEYRLAVARYNGAVDFMRRANITPDAFGYGTESFRNSEDEVQAAKQELERIAASLVRAANS